MGVVLTAPLSGRQVGLPFLPKWHDHAEQLRLHLELAETVGTHFAGLTK